MMSVTDAKDHQSVNWRAVLRDGRQKIRRHNPLNPYIIGIDGADREFQLMR
jgi:hypothetical protein